MRKIINRRSFLRASGICIALPALEAMNPVALAHRVESPKRMVLICSSLGIHGPSLFPKTTGRNYESTSYLELLKDHRDQYTIFSGLSHPDQSGKSGHSSQMTWLTSARNPGLGSFRNSISIDQLVAEKYGFVTRFPSVVLATGGQTSQSYNRNGVMVPAEYRPSIVFQKMFMQGGEREVLAQKRKLQQGQSILDSLGEQTQQLKKRISAGDRDRLDEYFESIRQTENKFQQSSQWLDKPKPKVSMEQPDDIDEAADIIGQSRLLMDLIPLILQTDSSRLVTVLVNGRNDVPPLPGVSLDHHNLSHHGQDENKIAQLQKIETEILKTYSGMLQSLKTKNDNGANLLDNTIVLFGSNLGNANAHDWRNLPILLAGGGLEHGSHVRFDKNNNTPLCNLFVTMIQKMGLEVDRFGSSSGTITL